MKKLKTISLIIMTIILTYTLTGITKVSAATTDANILKAGYGFKNINLAPRTIVNKNYSNKKGESTDYYFAYNTIDDKEQLKNFKDIGVYYPSKDKHEDLTCMIPGCDNKEHCHFTDKGEWKTGIVNTKKQDIIARLQKGYGIYTKPTYIKENKVTSIDKTIIATDFPNLKSSTQLKAIFKNNKVSSINRSMRISYSYTNSKLNLILSDNSGIASGKASIKITDRNTGKVVASLNAKKLAKKLTNTTKNKNGKIQKGVYSIDVSKLTTNKNGTYSIRVDTVEATGLKGYDMAKFVPATAEEIKKAEAQIPTSMEINREVRTSVDTSDKNTVKINLKDDAGISEVNLTTYTAANKKIKSYSLSKTECNTNKTLENKYITYKGYNEKTKMATIEINKSYFTKYSGNKNHKLELVIEAKDLSGLRAKEKISIRPADNTWKVNRGTRTSVSYKNNILYLTFKDNDGIATGDFNINIYDANTNKIVNPRVTVTASLFTNVKRNNNTIIKGTYPLDISKLQKDKDGKYKIKVRAEDSTGRYRVEVIKLKPYYNK